MRTSTCPCGDPLSLKALSGDVESALEHVRVPAYVIDRHGIIRWTNAAAGEIAGNVLGLQFTSVVTPEDRVRGREVFTRNLFGPSRGSDNRVTIVARGERLDIEVSAVPLKRGNHVIGVFGQVKRIYDTHSPPPHPSLTPRQTQVLRMLEHGLSTDQIADELHLTVKTVRNHIGRLLRALGVHTRLEAVAVSRRSQAVVS